MFSAWKTKNNISTFTFAVKLICIRCGQTITAQDFTEGNCQVIFPEAIIQHQTCPLIKTNPPCAFSQTTQNHE